MLYSANLKRLVLQEDGTVFNPDSLGRPLIYLPKIIGMVPREQSFEARFYPYPSWDTPHLVHGQHWGFVKNKKLYCGIHAGKSCLFCDYVHKAFNAYEKKTEQWKVVRTLRCLERFMYTVYMPKIELNNEEYSESQHTEYTIRDNVKLMHLIGFDVGPTLHATLSSYLRDHTLLGVNGTASFRISKERGPENFGLTIDRTITNPSSTS
jgi:hypothetical protein